MALLALGVSAADFLGMGALAARACSVQRHILGQRSSAVVSDGHCRLTAVARWARASGSQSTNYGFIIYYTVRVDVFVL